jgi:hypothetical protein
LEAKTTSAADHNLFNFQHVEKLAARALLLLGHKILLARRQRETKDRTGESTQGQHLENKSSEEMVISLFSIFSGALYFPAQAAGLYYRAL